MTVTTIESQLGKLIAEQQLDRVEFSTHDGKTFWATAYPAPWSTVVRERRDAGFRASDKFPSFSLAEADEIRRKAYDEPICRAQGNTITEAVEALIAKGAA
jgi:hypothetical protein